LHVLKRWDTQPPRTRWTIGVIAAVVVVLAIGWVVLVPTADWLATHDVGSVTGPLRTLRLQTARDVARGRLLTLGAGLFAAGALIFTARNYRLGRLTLEVTEQGQVTDRYTKAIEQLGSDKHDVRIGGIYALERIAHDSTRDHPTVVEVLAAFVREHCREQPPPADPDPGIGPATMRGDVQAALTVIGRRDSSRDRRQIGLARSNLSGSYLKGATLAGATFFDADLSGAILIEANVSHAVFTGTKLVHATLIAANVAGANLTGADLTSANLMGADLTGANLAGANLTRAMLGSGFSPTLHNKALPGANLTEANLVGANLIGANLTDANLTNAILGGVDLTSVNLNRTDLTGALLAPDAPVPNGWQLDPAHYGHLKRVDACSGNAATT
jgi:uncharacterized protein YjbI with pentapeptide repeats